MSQPNSCFAGRIIVREDGLAGLVWNRPCLIPTEIELPMGDDAPSMWFCPQHGDAIYGLLYELYEGQGLINHALVGRRPDAFDDLMQQLGPLEGQ